jgi:hypothetical protein
MERKHGIIRTIYLYLFALVGLALLVVGVVRFLDMGLKVFVFTHADDPEKIQRNYYYSFPIPVEKLEASDIATVLTADEKIALKNFLESYKKWQEDEAQIDYLGSKRQKEASINLALILVGLPLYLYHWRTIKKDIKSQDA